MDGDARDPDVERLLAELLRTLRRLERELGPRRLDRRRPPTPGELGRFASEIAIPAAILGLRGAIESLRLAQRGIRTAEGRSANRTGGSLADRTGAITSAAMAGLEDALGELEDAVAGRPPDDDARDLIERSRELRAEIASAVGDETGSGGGERGVPMDVDAELRTIREAVEEAPGDSAGPGDGAGGEDTGDEGEPGDDAGPT